MIFDTHAHYDDEAFDGDREELLSGLAAGGIGTVVNVGADMASTKTTIALTEKYPFIYGAAGVHPSSTAELDEEKFAELRVLAQSGKIVARSVSTSTGKSRIMRPRRNGSTAS